jgi:hypothetical protein
MFLINAEIADAPRRAWLKFNFLWLIWLMIHIKSIGNPGLERKIKTASACMITGFCIFVLAATYL